MHNYLIILVFYSPFILDQAIKPTVLIGSSGVGRTFTKEVIEAVSSFNEVLLTFSYIHPLPRLVHVG